MKQLPVLLIITAAFLPRESAHAQISTPFTVEVRTTSETGEPIEDALVRVFDKDEREASSAITDRNGFARVRVPHAGTYVFRVERLGYENWISAPQALTGPSREPIQLRVRVQPIQLAEIAVATSGDCRESPPLPVQGLRAVAKVLARAMRISSTRELPSTEARSLLVAAHQHAIRGLRNVTESRPASATFVMQTIATWPEFSATHDSVVTRVDTLDERRASPLSAPPAEWLAEQGFAQPRDSFAALPRYFVPSPEVISSEVFASTHCFRGVSHPDSTNWIGLVFEPKPNRQVTDVRGAVWVDTTAARVVRIEYYYTRLEDFLSEHEMRYARAPNARSEFRRGERMVRPVTPEILHRPYYRPNRVDPRENDFGGVIEFARLPDGRWDVANWQLVWPALRAHARYAGSRAEMTRGLADGKPTIRLYDVNINYHVIPYTVSSRVVEVLGSGSR